MADGFVFHDPTGRRWTRVRHGLRVAAVVLCIFAAVLTLALLTAPQVPALGLGSVAHVANSDEVRSIIAGERPAKNVPFAEAKRRNFVRSPNPVIHHKIAARVRDDQPLVFGYYVNWDPSSMVSLRLNLSRLTHLVPEWLILANSAGDLDDQTDPTTVRIAADAHLPILAMLTNFRDGWQAKDLHSVLTNADSRKDLIDNIYNNLVEHKFAGVSIDFEQLGTKDREPMVRFMEELHAKLHPSGLLLTQSVPVEDPAYDLRRLAQIDDYVIPMVYDEHYQSGEPGPVASQDWFEKKLDELAKALPENKTVIGIGNYGYDWVIGGRGSTEVAYDDVMAAAQQNKTPIAWDERMQSPVLRYEANGTRHEVWFLDAVTALNQVRAAGDSGFRGVALWRMGAEDPEFWTLFGSNKWPDENFSTTNLFNLSAQKSVSQYGNGEVLRITSVPQEGKRNVWVTKDDDYAEQYQSLPSYFVVEASGAPAKDSKLVSLSFDDGPDPQFTPAVLQILKAKQVPATFFVVGINAEENPGLLEREYAAGHTIGNHTYDHPNVATISEEATRRELNATQRLIENATGHSTTLFRPPYNADSEPRTPAEIVPMLRAQNMGYVTVGERIDPQDWRKGVTPEEIINEVVAEAKDGGQLILLHDAGGDRTATVQALPKLIDSLRAQGYQFVSLPELLGKSRDQLMPVPSASELRWAQIEGKALDAKGGLKRFIGVLFLAAIYLTLARSLVYGTLAVIQKFRARRLRFDPSFHPPVSVVIAAYNEEAVIARTVRSILDDGYDDLEVVVVDDGSKDATDQILKDEFGSEPRVRILTQANGGKSSALNRAIAQARNNILVAVDADTIFRKGAIGLLVRHFSDPKVGAVSGNARVGNRHNWITRFQSIEYICGFNLDRRALDVMNAITVVPGAVGAWRKDLIDALGGFGHDTLAEDTDLTLAIRRAGYKIRYEERAIAYTEAPETTKALAKQRFRWAFGTLQAAWKHRDVTLDPRYGFLGMIAMPSIWVFQVALAAISPFAEVAMLIALYAGNWRIVLLFYLAFFVLEALTALLAYALERENPKDLLLLFFQRIYFRGLMQYVLGKSLIYALRGRLVGWGKLERTARVQEA
jgi:cellulose synthase/poly-beta-1,6-N-acetylglucosamine synthase-like glycosyltransferase/peptidoglycan/xylan/chitin deacetylase (PgdA/CDA1 family)/spore germination protein YaaH